MVVGGETVSRNAGVKLRWSHPSGSEHCLAITLTLLGHGGERGGPVLAWLPTCVARG